ncbi:MAG: type II toxin-antitoxin system RelE/ParE family toxin [Anaerolineaceae bacterium]|nr:type II toxin-antitoxin system RelE/ParE family toxin [Anaerolineales bacterium]MEB2333400.1 type II toxin-antitoxin system RelE/ParE family toxin [Anaerolineaceae bacterium]OQY89009.1 MAG: cytotoxin [Anaerolineae bacterium UTCFX1]
MYKIIYTTQATKSLLNMPRNTAKLIREKIEQVAADPFSSIPNAKKLQGRDGYRLRVGDWRVIYEVNKKEITIIVLKVAPRGEVYR